jgi:hypothetical protein
VRAAVSFVMEIHSDTSATADSQATQGVVAVRLGSLAAESLAASAQPRAESLKRALAQAVAYYLGPGRDTAGWAFPKLLVPDSEPAGTVTVELDPMAWDQIVAEAERQAVEPDALVQHMTLFFGAARDAGRLTDRLLEGLDRERFGSTRGSAV